MLDDAKTHIVELRKMLKLCEYKLNDDEKEYLARIDEFLERFKSWYPVAYGYIDGGCMQGVSANCRMGFELWDNDNEEKKPEPDGIPEHETYIFRHDEWNRMIEDGTKSGELKPIM